MSFWRKIFQPNYVPEGRLSALDREKAQERWQWVTDQMELGKLNNLQLAIIEADKIIDELLKVIFPGTETMGERLKLAKKLFRDYQVYNDLWYGHKVRNALVHETEVPLTNAAAIDILKKYRAALTEIAGV